MESIVSQRASNFIQLSSLATADQILLAGVLFGLAVHWRIYPVIYALPVLLSLPSAPAPAGNAHSVGAAAQHGDGACGSGSTQALRGGDGSSPSGGANDSEAAANISQQRSHTGFGGSGCTDKAQTVSRRCSAVHLARRVCTRQRLRFGCAAAAIFLGLAALFYQVYGWQFVEVGFHVVLERMFALLRLRCRYNIHALHCSKLQYCTHGFWHAKLFTRQSKIATKGISVSRAAV